MIFYRHELPSKEEQIEALLKFDATDLALKYVDFSRSDTSTFEKRLEYRKAIFTVTKTEILEYVKAHYTFEELGLYKDWGDHGFCLRKEENGYRYFYRDWDQEARGLCEEGTEHEMEYIQDKNRIYQKYVDFVTGSSGTGLSFLTPEEEREEKRLAEEKEQFLIVQKRVHRNLRGALVKGILKKGLPPEKKEALMAKINSGDWEKYVAEVEKALGA